MAKRGTDVLVSGSWDEYVEHYMVYWTPAPVSFWWATHPDEWVWMGWQTWHKAQQTWEPPHLWGYAGVGLRKPMRMRALPAIRE